MTALFTAAHKTKKTKSTPAIVFANAVAIAFTFAQIQALDASAFAQTPAQPQTPAAADAPVGDNDNALQVAVSDARKKVDAEPQDALARFQLGRALRKAGQSDLAAGEYLEATSLDPKLYIAYHELALSHARTDQLDEAIDRLNVLKDERPRDLMLRVGLSELLESRGNNYLAARTLIDMVFQNKVPESYSQKVNARIHYLLSKNKETQTDAEIKMEEAPTADDTLPPPLPEDSAKRSLKTPKSKPGKDAQNFGHTPLTP